MEDLKYTFLPFLRQGLGGLIKDVDNLGAGTSTIKARANVKVKIQAKGTKVSNGSDELLNFTPAGATSTDTYDKEVDIFGPGDIIGVNKDAVVRTDPSDWVTNFEPNFLPYIEFWDEDFPWRYTPFAPSGTGVNQKLRPWLTLVVLKEDEFVKVSEFNGILPSFKINNKAYQDIFPDEKSMWAWASVHINQEITGNDTNAQLASLKNKLEENPSLAVSRIICPRRLEENIGYHCFLIPTFEMGRQAGLGEVNETDLQKPSWAWNGTTTSNQEFPYYYEWFFKTGKYGDFESLSDLLQPIIIDSESIGTRLLDIQDVGNSNFENLTPAPPDTVQLRGVLRPTSAIVPNDNWWNPPIDEDPSAFKTELKNFVNLSTDYLTAGINPLDPNQDPVITPPMYGRWHAKVNNLDTAKTDWLNKINLDPKFRILASAGAEVVRKNQEEFMQMAWEQVKDVEEANRLINQLQLGMESAEATYQKAYENVSDENKLLLTSNVHVRVIGENNETVYKNTKDSIIPDACFTGSFIKASRTNGFIANNFSSATPLNTSTLISNLNASAIQVSNVYSAPSGQNSLNVLQPFMISSSFVMSQPPRPNFLLTVPSVNFYSPGMGGMNSVTASLFQNSVSVVNSYIGNIQPTIAAKPSLDLVNVAQVVTDNIKPSVSILAVANKLLNIRSSVGQSVSMTAIKPIMACPKIEIPTFKYLYEESPDLIVPNLNGLPQNSVSIMELNREEIEAYLVGMNHEMAAELLWREYPTDQRGTVFSRFFGSYSNATAGDELEKTRAIKPIHTWRNGAALTNLGSNKPQVAAANILVLAIRGELLKKYPNTIVYAQKAKWQKAANGTTDDTTKPRIPTDDEADILKPIMYSQEGDIAFFGFDISKETALGTSFTGNIADDTTKPGYFFMLKEMVGEVHYGLDEFNIDEPIILDPTELGNWEDINWGHMGGNKEDIKFVKTNVVFRLNPLTQPSSLNLNKNSADISAILLRKPAFICLHAKELLL